MKDNLTLAYMQDLKIIKESEDLGNDVDELMEENTTTIDESLNIEDNEEDNEEDDGWSDKVQSICDTIINKFDGFSYELKNCKRGSFTECKNETELVEWLENIKFDINEAIESLKR